jgi:hypothetical protein
MDPRRAGQEALGRVPGGSRRQIELRWLGSRESAWLREVRAHFQAHPLEYDERGFPIEQPPRTMADDRGGSWPARGV